MLGPNPLISTTTSSDPSQRILFIVGPSAVGKSAVGLVVAERLGAEIISCDAMQVYREINVASDKPTMAMQSRVPHHCVNVVSVKDTFDVARYRQEALKALSEVRARHKPVVIVGGSGMYMTVLLDGIFDEGIKDESLRAQLGQQMQQQGALAMHRQLDQVDPTAATKIHPNDHVRILRALEVVLSTGKPISQLQPKRDGLWGKEPISIVALNRPREELYARVEARVEAMFANGLVDEIKKVMALPLSHTAKSLMGIPEMSGYLNGEYDLEWAKYMLKLNTRHYAKRQMTWFRRDERITWIDINPHDTLEALADRVCA